MGPQVGESRDTRHDRGLGALALPPPSPGGIVPRVTPNAIQRRAVVVSAGFPPDIMLLG
jgi:hypothetical protein